MNNSLSEVLNKIGEDYKDNIRDNLFSPLLLSNICKEFNCHFTYLGTGCIFNYDNIHIFGQDKIGFTEEDEANFFGSSYSINIKILPVPLGLMKAFLIESANLEPIS